MSSTYLSVFYQLIATLSISKAVLAAPSVWDINIEEGPAPPPDQGPPISANAIRDTAYLPYDLVALFGSYLVSIIIVGIAIVIIGRRRKAIQRSPQSLGMEMKTSLTGDGRGTGNLKAMSPPRSNKLFGPSPVSPTKFWQSPNLSMKNGWETIAGKSSQKTSIAGVSIATVDESVIEDDRMRNEVEMDRLYAAVAEFEDARGNGANGLADQSVRSQNPPELQHLRYGSQPLTNHGPAEMVEPYPSRTSTVSPHRYNNSVSPPARSASGGSARRGKKTPPAPLSLNPTAHSSRSSLASAKSRSIRHFPISPPMGSPGMAPDFGDIYSDAEPLTPRAYAPGPPPIPPTPGSAVTFIQDSEVNRHRDVLASPQHPPDFVSPRATHFAPSIRSSRSSAATANQSFGLPMSPRSTRAPLSARSGTFPRTITEQPSVEAGLRPMHSRDKQSIGGQSYASCESDIKPGFNFALDPAPSGRASPANSTHTNASASLSLSAKKGRKAAPPTLALTPSSANTSSTNLAPQTQLPLRNATLPLRDLRSPSSRGPPSAIKATFLERPAKRGPAGGLLRAPGTAGLAGPATPYSPYMPQTPMTPMTPSRLVTREERKRREKEEGRRVLTQEDVVLEESEMWE